MTGPVVYKAGRRRKCVVAACCLLWCYVGYELLGNTGFGLFMLGVLARWRRHDWHQPLTLVAEGVVDHYWQMAHAIAFKFPGQRWQWVFDDEVSPEDYAALRRFAKLRLDRQPVGLSISR